jgi:hypothetical protein
MNIFVAGCWPEAGVTAAEWKRISAAIPARHDASFQPIIYRFSTHALNFAILSYIGAGVEWEFQTQRTELRGL